MVVLHCLYTHVPVCFNYVYCCVHGLKSSSEFNEMLVFGILCTERWKHCSQLCFHCAVAHTQISRRILIMRQCAEEPCERGRGWCLQCCLRGL